MSSLKEKYFNLLLNRLRESLPWLDNLIQLPNFSQKFADIVLSSLFINILSLALPVVLMQVYDRIIPNEGMITLLWLIFGCIIAIIFESILRTTRAFISGWMAAQFEYTTGTEAVETLLMSRLDEFEKDGFGVHLDRLNAVGTLRSLYAGQVFQVLLDLPFALLFIGAIMYISPALSLIPIFITALFFFIVHFAKKEFETSRNDQLQTNERKFNFIIQVLKGIHLLRTSAIEEQMLRRYEELQAKNAKANMLVNFWNMLPGNLGGMFALATMFLIIGFGGALVIDGNLTLGALTACMLLSGRVMQPIQQIAGFWVRFSDATIAHEQLQKIRGMTQEVPKGTPAFPSDIEGAVELRDVAFKYRDDLPYIFQGINIKVAPRQMVVIGSSGSSGTTTLLYLMMGALQPSEGTTLLDDYNLAEWDHTNLSGTVEYLPQAGILFKGTIIENISMFDQGLEGAAHDAAALLELDQLIADLPLGYETVVDNHSTHMLPSGLVQGISIARALVIRPRILFLDKTNAALDSESEETFRNLIEHLKGHCTIVFVTNNPYYQKMADETYELDGGLLVKNEKEDFESVILF